MLGKQLELFTDRPGGRLGAGLLAAQGGRRFAAQLENFLYGELIRRGYQPVYTPVIGNVEFVRDFGPLSVLQGLASSRRSRWQTASATCCGR